MFTTDTAYKVSLASTPSNSILHLLWTEVLGQFFSVFPVFLHKFDQFQVMHLLSSVSRKIALAVDKELNMKPMNMLFTPQHDVNI
jgi:hypothetical protein